MNPHTTPNELTVLIKQYFFQRLTNQRQASHHTVKSYRDTFRQLFDFAAKYLGQEPSKLLFNQLDETLISAFLDDLETARKVSIRTRNLRLTAIQSFFRYAFEQTFPEHSVQIQKVLAIPAKRFVHKQIGFLRREEVVALLNAPVRSTWIGRRDHAFILTAVQTGLRVSEMTALKREDVILGESSHLRVFGKGRKQRCTPLAKSTRSVLTRWMREPDRGNSKQLFPNFRGDSLTIHGVQYMLKKHQKKAAIQCPTLAIKQLSVHLLRHTAAMELLQGGVDRSTIALWLGHEHVETTQIYVEATMEMKIQALAKVTPLSQKPTRFTADDQLMKFLDSL